MDYSKNAAEIFDKHAESYQERFMDVSMYTKSLDFLLSSIEKEQKDVLEIACGPGNITKYILGHNKKLKFDSTDLSPKMIKLAAKNNHHANCFVLDARNIKTLNKKYDIVIAGFAFPYLNIEEVKLFIQDVASMLKPNGLLYLSTMEDEYVKSGFVKGSKGDEMMMHYYNEEFFNMALSQNHFIIVFADRVRTTMTNGTEVVDLVMIAKSMNA